MVALTKLLATKLYIPRVRASLVARPRLLERLDAGMQGKLTLISALPGSGKTTLLSEWQATKANQHFPLAWVSLDESDNDATVFWSYIAKAIETLAPNIANDVLALLHSFPSPPIESVLIMLINVIDSTIQGDFALVLDDYHCIENEAIHIGLTFLLDHLPPSMHIILVTRVDPPLPLARLRVRGQLTEIRTADLRFTLAEAVIYLSQTMKLHLSAENATWLTDRTEGWIAGLQLAALSLRGQEDNASFLQNFSGNQRYVLEYLTQEVLERQPADVQYFLQHTAILYRLSPEICNAITEGTNGLEMLHWLDKANLFLISLDQEQYWYRYHALFRDFLLRTLHNTHTETYVHTLHLRAAAWYEQHALEHEAVHHLLASGDYERTTDYIERIARSMWMRGEGVTLQHWLSTLPEQIVHARPQLNLYFVWSLIASNRTRQAKQRLEEIMAVLQTHDCKDKPCDDEMMHAEALILQATLARFSGDVSRTLALSQQALEYLPLNSTILHSINTLNLAHAYGMRGDVRLASETFQQAITLGRAVDNTYTVILALNTLIRLQIEQGKLRSAFTSCNETQQFAKHHGCEHLLIMSQTAIKEGELFYEWNKLDEAQVRIEQGIALGQHKSNVRFLLQGYMALARVFHAQGEIEQAHTELAQAAELAREHHSSLLVHIEALEARLWLAEGNLPSALSWYERSGLNVDDTPNYAQEFLYLTLVRVLIAQGKLKDVVGLLERLHRSAVSGERNGTVIEILLLQAKANAIQNKKSEAFTAIERSLSLAEPEGYIRQFLDEGKTITQLLTDFLAWNTSTEKTKRLHTYVSSLLDTFARSSTLPLAIAAQSNEVRTRQLPFRETLGEREHEVLHYLATGLSNQAIADEMVVAVSTIKSHLKSIYRKLNVDSRTHAVARARELHLL